MIARVSATNVEGARICFANPSMRVPSSFLRIPATNPPIMELHHEPSTFNFRNLEGGGFQLFVGGWIFEFDRAMFVFHLANRRLLQTNRALDGGVAFKAHKRKRCSVDSGAWPHRGHNESGIIFLL
ncbi:uncharacterized protein LOC108955793 [Eucalyptus grandis]|uniref:uncharacterized protein LOC108955793 n=1 Tax=Eucalyptus grandis TaxID=71139 RepID=UPI00192F0738|nr:uncharacterized protein LOC108955793 [Eucalyptus grandis]